MLKVRDARQLGKGLADKTIGLAFEAVGTLTGNERLKESGRTRQDAGTERLMAVEEDAKATSRATEAKTQEQRQKLHQAPDKRSSGRSIAGQPSIAGGAAEKVKGLVKEGAGKVTGNEELRAEGEAQQDKAEAQAQAEKHEKKADFHEKKAEAELKESQAKR
jgi:uncharacterized protein YjbJ (UPF0337 family)